MEKTQEKQTQKTERHVPVGKYDGADLRDFDARQGAMHAFRLPSLAMGKLVYPKRDYGNQGPF